MIKVIVLILLVISSLCASRYTETLETYDASKVSPATKQEVLAFLIQDATNNTAYNRITYNCLNFAVDLWRNAYLEGMDAFLVLLNKEGFLTHVIVGFYAIETNECDQSYWFDRNGDWWFYVDPQRDYIYSRYHPDDIYGELSDEIITFIYGEDAFALWQEVSNKTLIKDDLIHSYLIAILYKTQRLFNTN